MGLMAAVLMIAARDAQAQPPRATIDAGVVQGVRVGPGNGEVAFLGIPFAAPPVGALRWAPPHPVAAWRGVRRTDTNPPICPQLLHHPEYFDGLAVRTGGTVPLRRRRLVTAEDCLTLSVWTAHFGERAPKRPVFVWIHGGGNIEGWNTQGLTDGMFLARRGIVVVSVEYRLGALGFLADAALAAESPNKSAGNYGLLDQIAALEWVRRNIAAFGGDPARVTIGGQSSGAEDVACLMASPLARGLFRGAIMESGACGYELSRLGQHADGAARLAADLGIAPGPGELAALRGVSAARIVEAANADTGWTGDVIVDGRVLPDSPARLFDEGRVARVPVLVGSNADEMRSLASSMPVHDLAAYDDRLVRDYGRDAARMRAMYPARDTAEAERRLFEITTDEEFGAPARGLARAMARVEREVYLYYFTHAIPTARGARLGAFHTGEMPFVFGSDPGWPRGVADARLRDSVSAYWTRFISGLAPWAPYDAYMELGDTIRMGRYLRQAQYDLLDQLHGDMSRQLLVVVTADWNAVDGTAFRFTRDSERPWRPVGKGVPVVVGRTGLAWGSRDDSATGPVKQEGDGRAPAGVFPFGTVFGFAAADSGLRMPYRPITAMTECVDDPRSAHYNSLVERDAQSVDWASSEKMRAVDPAYRIGVVVGYNAAPPVPGRGSCIFMHIWSGPTVGTDGCTAMPEPDLQAIIAWLDDRKQPTLVQMPRAEYEARRAAWDLPELPELP
jgi:para-nitrobenzyl esterase